MLLYVVGPKRSMCRSSSGLEVSCYLLPGLTCFAQFVLVKCDILQAGDHPSLVGFLEVAHDNMSNSFMPKPPKRRLGEEACHGACLL